MGVSFCPPKDSGIYIYKWKLLLLLLFLALDQHLNISARVTQTDTIELPMVAAMIEQRRFYIWPGYEKLLLLHVVVTSVLLAFQSAGQHSGAHKRAYQLD